MPYTLELPYNVAEYFNLLRQRNNRSDLEYIYPRERNATFIKAGSRISMEFLHYCLTKLILILAAFH